MLKSVNALAIMNGQLYSILLNLQSVAFLGLKMIQNTYLRKYITS